MPESPLPVASPVVWQRGVPVCPHPGRVGLTRKQGGQEHLYEAEEVWGQDQQWLGQVAWLEVVGRLCHVLSVRGEAAWPPWVRWVR